MTSDGGDSKNAVHHLIKQFESQRFHSSSPKIKKAQSFPVDINRLGKDEQRMFNFNEILSKINVVLKEYDQIKSTSGKTTNDNATPHKSLTSTVGDTTLRLNSDALDKNKKLTSISDKYSGFKSKDVAQFREKPSVENADDAALESNVGVNIYVSHLHEIVEVLLRIAQVESDDASVRLEKLSCLETLEDLHVTLKEIMDSFGKGAEERFKKRYLLKTNFRESLDSIRVRVNKFKLNEILKNVIDNRNSL